MARVELQSFVPWPFPAWHAALNLERGVLALFHAELCCPEELIPDYVWVWTSAGQNLDTLVESLLSDESLGDSLRPYCSEVSPVARNVKARNKRI